MAKQRTLAIIKPDAVAKKKQGEILQRIVNEGFEVLAMRQLTMSPRVVEGFYQEHVGKEFFADLSAFMSSGPCIVLALSREDAVSYWREVIGKTDPLEAAEGTVRKKYGEKKNRNAVHGSDSEESGLRECGFFFAGMDCA